MKFLFAKKKALILAISAALLLAGATGGALAYLTGEADPVVNSFVPGAVTCEVVQTVTGDAETGAKVRNTGNVRAWIRAAVVGNTVNADGYLTGNAAAHRRLLVLEREGRAAGAHRRAADGRYRSERHARDGACRGHSGRRHARERHDGDRRV